MIFCLEEKIQRETKIQLMRGTIKWLQRIQEFWNVLLEWYYSECPAHKTYPWFILFSFCYLCRHNTVTIQLFFSQDDEKKGGHWRNYEDNDITFMQLQTKVTNSFPNLNPFVTALFRPFLLLCLPMLVLWYMVLLSNKQTRSNIDGCLRQNLTARPLRASLY